MTIDTDYASPYAYAAWILPRVSIAAEAAEHTAQAMAVRAELWGETRTQAPFFLDELDENNIHVATIGSLGDIREARRRRASEAFDRGVPVGRISLTDRNGKAVS